MSDKPGGQTRGFGTECVHAGESPERWHGALGAPAYTTVTYAFSSLEEIEAMRAGTAPHFSYAPRGNPTVNALEEKIAVLEGAEETIGFSSGMAGISTVLSELVGSCGHLVASNALYDYTRDQLAEDPATDGIFATRVPINDLDAVAAAIRPETVAIYAEPVSNPMLQVTDLPALSRLAKERGLLLIVDNTFLSPAILQPIRLGADVVLHSATKYLSGTGMTQAGVASMSRELAARVRPAMMRKGNHMSPWAAWMLLVGVHTLTLRIERLTSNALAIATEIRNHPATKTVNYPAFTAPDALKPILFGEPPRFGGMLSFTFHGGQEANFRFGRALKLITIATSLGEPATLLWSWPNSDLLRISSGIEDERDLIADVRQALDAAV